MSQSTCLSIHVRGSMSERVVLLTGAAGGIGRATVQALAVRGFRVYAAVRPQSHPTFDQNVSVIPLDVTDPDSVAGAAKTFRARPDYQTSARPRPGSRHPSRARSGRARQHWSPCPPRCALSWHRGTSRSSSSSPAGPIRPYSPRPAPPPRPPWRRPIRTWWRCTSLGWRRSPKPWQECAPVLSPRLRR
ncbi:MAG TPA: SDR family NAD(P)-dependent oxidoreductase [Streptosporangiaceae bacterium]|nr:SDR family NAD(P)-dependent oxidoreductase [Streptosporangiaceae bacterium]